MCDFSTIQQLPTLRNNSLAALEGVFGERIILYSYWLFSEGSIQDGCLLHTNINKLQLSSIDSSLSTLKQYLSE
jgi:hypothetical protein